MDIENQNLSRKERERLFKQQEIIHAARDVFAMRGFSSSTLEEIADRAEFGKGTLYNYFQSKEELFETVIADAVDEFIEIATEHCTDSSRDLRTSYMGFARSLMKHLFANFGIYGLVMREFHKMESNTHIATLMPNLILIVAEPLERAMAKGEIEPLHSGKTAMTFITMVFSLFKSTLHIHHADALLDPERRISLANEQIDEGIAGALCIIERTFFSGIYAKSTDISPEWCQTK